MNSFVKIKKLIFKYKKYLKLNLSTITLEIKNNK